MSELVYDNTGRLLFTKEMKESYTLLIPQMLPVHFNFLTRLFQLEGYKAEMLSNSGPGVLDNGQRYVHNDTCFPAILVIGQLLDAVKSGKYDPHKVALLITQTGGGCRASNYIHMLRKALEKAGLSFVPVVSVNMSGFEKNPGFTLSLSLLRKLVYIILYGDLIMSVANQVRPYEVTPGAADQATADCTELILEQFNQGKGLSYRTMNHCFDLILQHFDRVEVAGKPKVRVGVVGEIYVKYSPLGNNNLEEFLLSEGVEPVVPGLLDFMLFKIHNREVDVNLYGGSPLKKLLCQVMSKYIKRRQNAMIAAIVNHGRFRAPGTFDHLRQFVPGYLGEGNKMGEGWLLTAEMLELIHSGTPNIVCTQPFGCLPNHIVGKGMIRKLKDEHPDSNIVAIDYDPGATKINQENRIKLMLSNAKGRARPQPAAPVPDSKPATGTQAIPAPDSTFLPKNDIAI